MAPAGRAGAWNKVKGGLERRCFQDPLSNLKPVYITMWYGVKPFFILFEFIVFEQSIGRSFG